MNATYPNLFRSLQVGSLRLKNRIQLAPMSFTVVGPAGGYSKDNIAFYEAVARGGAGLVTLGETIVSLRNGKTHPHIIRIREPEAFSTLADVAEAVHRHGAAVSVEISHGGGVGPYVDPALNYGNAPIGPSGFLRADGARVREMDESAMNEVADDFAASAETLKRAGFDMVMVHAGHGWLLAQFLSPAVNKRRDKYGGSLENRARFPMMVIDRIRERVGRSFPLEMRISGYENRPEGLKVEDTAAFCAMVQDRIDLVQVSAGGIYSDDGTRIMSPGMFMERGCNVHLAETVKKAVRIPVAGVGGLVDPRMMEEIIASGRADMVTLGRALIADPELPRKAKEGREREILSCLRCTECHGRLFDKGSWTCTINPSAGREYEAQFAVPPPRRRRRVMVAGGGPGGMQAAIAAAERGHEVELFEKSDRLGGALKFADSEPFKADLARFYRQLIERLAASGVRSRCGVEVTPELVRSEAPDVLIVAVGAEPIVPPIPGMDSPKVILGVDAYSGRTDIGETVAIVGGGLVGCEIAVHLAREGKKVTVVEMLDSVAPDANPPHRNGLMHELGSVDLRTRTRCLEINALGVRVRDRAGAESLIPADSVIVSVGMRPLAQVVDRLEAAAAECVAIGDCVKPGKAGSAIQAGYFAAVDL